MFSGYLLRLRFPPIAMPKAAITGPAKITQTGCRALVIASMLGTLGDLTSPVSAGWVATCNAPNVKPINRATTARTNGALPPRAMSAHTRPATNAVTKITVNCITVHCVDAWYDLGLNDQSAPITVYTVMKVANCKANITR